MIVNVADARVVRGVIFPEHDQLLDEDRLRNKTRVSPEPHWVVLGRAATREHSIPYCLAAHGARSKKVGASRAPPRLLGVAG